MSGVLFTRRFGVGDRSQTVESGRWVRSILAPNDERHMVQTARVMIAFDSCECLEQCLSSSEAWQR